MDTNFLGDSIDGFAFGKAQPHQIVNVDKRKDTPPPPRDDDDARPTPIARLSFASAGKKKPWNGTVNPSQERMRVDDILTHDASNSSSAADQRIRSQQSQTPNASDISHDGFRQSAQQHQPVSQAPQTLVDHSRDPVDHINQIASPNQPSSERAALPQSGRATPPKAIDEQTDLPLNGMFATGRIRQKQMAAAASKTQTQPSHEGQLRPTESAQLSTQHDRPTGSSHQDSDAQPYHQEAGLDQSDAAIIDSRLSRRLPLNCSDSDELPFGCLPDQRPETTRRSSLDAIGSRQDRQPLIRVADDDVFGSPQELQGAYRGADGEPVSSPSRSEQLDVPETPDLTEHIAGLTQRGMDSLRPASPTITPRRQAQSSIVTANQSSEPPTVLREYKTRHEETSSALAHFGVRKSLPREQATAIDPPTIESTAEVVSDDDAGSEDIAEIDDHVQEEPDHTDEDTDPTFGPASQNTEITSSPAGVTTRPGIAVPRPRVFDHMASRSSIGYKDNALKSPLRQRLTVGNHTPSQPKRRLPEIGVLRSQPLPSQKNDRMERTDLQSLTEGGKDEYVTIGLLMRAQERERMLGDTTKSLEAERAKIVKLEMEILSIQFTCGLLKQQQRETTQLSEKAKREDLKQRNKLRLEIKKTKEHVESLRTISAAHEQRYAAALRNHEDTFQAALQKACDLARTEVHVETQAGYAADLKRLEDELSEAKTCLNSSGEEARKQTEECIRLHEELEDVRKRLSENKEEMTRWEKLHREANAERLKCADKLQTLEAEKSSAQSEHSRLQERLQNQDRNFAEKQEHVQAQIASLGAEKSGLIEQIERLKELLERQTVKTTEKEREYYALAALYHTTLSKLESEGDLSEELREDLQAVQQANIATQERYETERNLLAEATRDLQEQQRALEDFDAAAKRAATETATAKQSLQEFQAAAKEKQTRIDELEKELKQANNRYQQLATSLEAKANQSTSKMNEVATQITQLAAVNSSAQDNTMKNLLAEKATMSSTIQTLEKEKTSYQTDARNHEKRLADHKARIEALDQEMNKRGARYDEQKEQLRLLQLKQKEESVKLAQAALRDQELQKKIEDLQEAERERLAHEQGALQRFRENGLTPTEYALCAMAIKDTINEANARLVKEVNKRNTVIEKQNADISKLKKDKAMVEAEVRTANMLLAKKADRSGRNLIPSDGWTGSSENGHSSSHGMEMLDQDPDLGDDDLLGDEPMKKAGSQPARSTQMPQQGRVQYNGESAGTQLAREAMLGSNNLVVLDDMLAASGTIPSEGGLASFVPDSLANRPPASFVPDSMTTNLTASQVTGRLKFSQLAQAQGTSSPTSGRYLALDGRDDVVNQEPSQDPIEDDSEDEVAPVISKSVTFAKPVTASKTRGQKRQAETTEEPASARAGLVREDSVMASQTMIYNKPVTKKQYGGTAKKAKTRASGRA